MSSPAVLITGALTGIGRAAALAFAKEGAQLVVSGRHDEAGTALIAELRDIGAEAEFIRADVRHEDEVQSLVDRTVARFGRLDVAVNNAGTEGNPGPVTEQTAEGFTAMFETNVLGTLLGMKHELRIMQAQDPKVYVTGDNNIEFYLEQMPDNFQVEVDGHSASPIFKEDNAQVLFALAKAGAIDNEDLVLGVHPPSTDRILTRQRQRQKQMAKQQQQEKQEQDMKDLLGIPPHKQPARGGKRGGATLHSIGILFLIGATLAGAVFGDQVVKAVYAAGLPKAQATVNFVRP